MKDKVWKGSSSTSYPEPEMNGPAAKMVTWQYDGIELAAWPSPHGGVVIVDTETPRLIDWVRDVRSVTSLQPACCRLACGMNDGRVVCLTVWRDSLRMQWRVETASNERGPRVERVSSSSDGNRFVTQRYGEETVRLYYCSSRTRLSCFALIKNPNIISLHLSATGMWFALATSREIRCWNATVLWSQDIIASSKVKDEQQEQKLETILFTSGIIPEHKPRRMVRWRGLRGTELLLTTSIDTALVFAAALINGETVLSLVWCLDIMGIELITWVQCGLHLNSSAELARSDTDNTPQERKRRPSKGSSGNLIHHHTDDETPRTDFHQHHARRPQAHFAGIAWIALVTRQDAKIETRLIALGPLAETQQPYEAIVRFEKFTQSSVISASALFAGEQPLSSALRSARFTLASSQFDASTAIWCPNSTRYLSHATWLDSNPTLLANAGPVQLIRLSDDQTSLVSSWAASDELPLPVISLQLNVCAACWDHQHSFVVITRDGALSIISLHGSLRARSSPRVLGNTLGLAKEMHLTALDGLAIFTMKKDETLLELSAYRYEIEDKKVKVTYLTTASERSACIYGGNSLSTVTATTSTDGTILALWNLLPDSKMFLRREFVRSDMRRTSSGASASSSSSSRRSMSNNQYTFRASTLTTTRERIAIVDHRAAIDFWRRVAVGPEDWQIETRLAPPADATADVVVASFCGRGLLAVVDAASHVRLFATTKQYGWRIVAVVDRPIPVAARCFLLDSHLPLFLRQDDANKSLMHMKNDEKNETSNLFASIVENNEEKDSAGLLEHLYKIAKKNAIGRLPIMGALCAKLVPNERFVDEDAFKAVGSNADTFLMNLSNDESSNNFSAPFREALAKHRLSWWAPVSKLRTVFVEAANALVRGRRRRLSGPPASILVALPYIVAGRVSTLASLAKADAVTDTAAGRFYKLLTAFDFSSDRGRLAATKNAFSLLAKHDDITAAAVFCLAKPPLILDAAQVAMDRLEDPDLALAIARLADDDESTNSTIRNPDHAELTIGRRHTHATKENGHKLKTTSSYYTRLVLKKLLLPKFRRQKDHAMEALALIWLDRPTAAARALDRLGKQLSTIHPSLPMPNFDTTFAALAVPTLLFALDVLRRATSADSRRRRRLAAIRAANAALCHGASETALSFLTCADIEIPLLPENKTAFDVHSSSALDDFDPAPQQRSALDSFDPAPQQRSALDSFDPAPQQRSALDSFDPAPQQRSALDSFDPAPQQRSALDSFDPAPQQRSALDDFDPAPQQRSALDSFDPAPQQRSALDDFDPAPQQRSALDSFDPAPQQRSALDDFDPAPQQRSALDSFDPAPQQRSALDDFDPAPQQRSALDSFDPAPQQRSALDDFDPAPQQRSALDSFDPAPQQRSALDSFDPAPQQRSALDDFDPAPQQRSALDSFDPAPQQRSALDSFDPAPQQRSALDSFDPAPQQRSALDSFDPAPQQRSASKISDPAPQQRSALDSFEPAPQQRSASKISETKVQQKKAANIEVEIDSGDEEDNLGDEIADEEIEIWLRQTATNAASTLLAREALNLAMKVKASVPCCVKTRARLRKLVEKFKSVHSIESTALKNEACKLLSRKIVPVNSPFTTFQDLDIQSDSVVHKFQSRPLTASILTIMAIANADDVSLQAARENAANLVREASRQALHFALLPSASTPRAQVIEIAAALSDDLDACTILSLSHSQRRSLKKKEHAQSETLIVEDDLDENDDELEGYLRSQLVREVAAARRALALCCDRPNRELILALMLQNPPPPPPRNKSIEGVDGTRSRRESQSGTSTSATCAAAAAAIAAKHSDVEGWERLQSTDRHGAERLLLGKQFGEFLLRPQQEQQRRRSGSISNDDESNTESAAIAISFVAARPVGDDAVDACVQHAIIRVAVDEDGIKYTSGKLGPCSSLMAILEEISIRLEPYGLLLEGVRRRETYADYVAPSVASAPPAGTDVKPARSLRSRRPSIDEARPNHEFDLVLSTLVNNDEEKNASLDSSLQPAPSKRVLYVKLWDLPLRIAMTLDVLTSAILINQLRLLYDFGKEFHEDDGHTSRIAMIHDVVVTGDEDMDSMAPTGLIALSRVGRSLTKQLLAQLAPDLSQVATDGIDKNRNLSMKLDDVMESADEQVDDEDKQRISFAQVQDGSFSDQGTYIGPQKKNLQSYSIVRRTEPVYNPGIVELHDGYILAQMLHPRSGVALLAPKAGNAWSSTSATLVAACFSPEAATAWLVEHGHDASIALARERLAKWQARRIVTTTLTTSIPQTPKSSAGSPLRFSRENASPNLREVKSVESFMSPAKEISGVRRRFPALKDDEHLRFVDAWEVEPIDDDDQSALTRSTILGRLLYEPLQVDKGEDVFLYCHDQQNDLRSPWAALRCEAWLTTAIAQTLPPSIRQGEDECTSGNDPALSDACSSWPPPPAAAAFTDSYLGTSEPFRSRLRRYLYRNAMYRRNKMPRRFIALIQIELVALENIADSLGGTPGTPREHVAHSGGKTSHSTSDAYAVLRLKHSRPAGGGASPPLTEKVRTRDSAVAKRREHLDDRHHHGDNYWGVSATFRFALPDEALPPEETSQDNELSKQLFTQISSTERLPTRGPPQAVHICVYQPLSNPILASIGLAPTENYLGDVEIPLAALTDDQPLQQWLPLRASGSGSSWFVKVKISLRFLLMAISSHDGEAVGDSNRMLLRKYQKIESPQNVLRSASVNSGLQRMSTFSDLGDSGATATTVI